MNFELNDDNLVLLDAESLAETGIKEAYVSLLPALRQYVPRPADIEEIIDNEAPKYVVKCQGREYVIYALELNDEAGESWGRATWAFFCVVNNQLENSTHRLYAINGGNDLGGMFLTPGECEASKQSLPSKTDWPYLPVLEAPWYGQHH
jgi:hypothetical protein